MFSWLNKLLRKSDSPKAPGQPNDKVPLSGNPAKGFQLTLAVNGPARMREEKIDLVQVLSGTLARLGREHSVLRAALVDAETGLEFRPGIVSFQPNDDLSMRMCTTIETRHPVNFPKAFFEYQHSGGQTGEMAVAQGFEDWANLDLPVILDALEPKLRTCTALEFPLPPDRTRRVLFGPVCHWGPTDEEIPAGDSGEASHPRFCRCCLFTQSIDPFQSLMNSDGFHAIRLYAMRNEDGTAQADCRVNGEDFPEGESALVAYVRSWASTGFEARKQYIVIQDQPSTPQSDS